MRKYAYITCATARQIKRFNKAKVKILLKRKSTSIHGLMRPDLGLNNTLFQWANHGFKQRFISSMSITRGTKT